MGLRRYSVGLVGYGAWGKKLEQEIQRHEWLELKWIGTRSGILTPYPDGSAGYSHVQRTVVNVLSHEKTDIVFFACGPEDQWDLAMRAAYYGSAVFLEKPMALTVAQATLLVDEVTKHHAPCVVDHTHLYNEEWSWLRSKIAGISPPSGASIRSIDITMGGEGPVRNHHPWWDYGPHAVALVLDVMRRGYGAGGFLLEKADVDANSVNATFRCQDVPAQIFVSNKALRQRRCEVVLTNGSSLVFADGLSARHYVEDGFTERPVTQAVRTPIRRAIDALIFQMAHNGSGVDQALFGLEVVKVLSSVRL